MSTGFFALKRTENLTYIKPMNTQIYVNVIILLNKLFAIIFQMSAT